MNRKIGIICSIINCVCVVLFAICMLCNFEYGSYFVCMFIAFSFVPMISSFSYESEPDRKVAGYSAVAFAGVYTVIILLVYFAQLATVRLGGLNEQAMKLINFKSYGLFFSYDLLGYGLMALSTFFAGLTINAKNRIDKWLKWLLIIHGVFFVSCLIIPMLGVFSADLQNADLIGVALLEFWCVYFSSISILSFLHFKNSSVK